MKNIFQPGAIKVYSKIVQPHEKAEFDSGVVHEVYSTFYLAKDAEWSTRLFVLEMKENDEEGIGTFIHVDHLSPALIGSEIDFYAKLDEVNGNSVICSFEAKCGDRLIASGRTGQKILKKEKLEAIMNLLESDNS
jgi:predicted thioesterase